MRVSKTLKALISIFIVIYVLFLFEIVILNRSEIVSEITDTFVQPEVCVVEEPAETTITFFGDMMFDRGVWHSFKNIGITEIFSNLDKSKFINSDIVFANLEGPVSAEPIADVWIDDSLNFNMPPETLDALKYLNMDGVSLANNHTLNAGIDGFATTQTLLDQNSIKYAGYQNSFDAGSILRFETEIPVSVICASFLGINPDQKIKDTIQAEKGRFVIVFPHWGAEYATTHNSTQERLAHGWVDAGASAVVGSHPHVVQDIEIYNDVPIFYSLGNFVFDQGFSKETQEGLAVKLTVTEDKVQAELMPFASDKMKPKFLEQPEEEIKTHLNIKKYLEYYLNGSIIINKSDTK